MILELKRFLQTAQEGNITKTAEKIFITQSALTQSIQRLEKELSTKLFIQKGKSLELTVEGKYLTVVGTKILQLWENAKDPELRIQTTPNYSIGMFDNVALRLSPFLQKNMHTNEFRLELIIDSSSKLLSQLKLGILDAAICITNKKIYLPKNVKLLQTFDEELIPVSSTKFTNDITNVPFIFYNKDSFTRQQTDDVFSEKNISPFIFAESTSTTFMKELALLGSGVALLPKNFIKTELVNGTLIKQNMKIQWKREYGLYINELGGLNKNNKFIRQMVTALKKAQ